MNLLTAKYFQEQYLEKLDRLDLIENLMWDNYQKEKDLSVVRKGESTTRLTQCSSIMTITATRCRI